MIIQIWYMKPEWFPEGIFGGARPDPKNLAATHVHLKDVEQGVLDLEKLYREMQGEIWSPNGEARDLILSKGLSHTSMSVGDVVVVDGAVFIVAIMGFKELT